jgi:CheY-like chemotaxis protein
MDLQMPRLSGFEASASIRKLEKMRGITRTPILALSANVLKGVRDECVKCGMDGYVSKPVRQPELLGAMSQLIPHLFVDRQVGDFFLAQQLAKGGSASPTSAVFGTPMAQHEPQRQTTPPPQARPVAAPREAVQQAAPTVPIVEPAPHNFVPAPAPIASVPPPAPAPAPAPAAPPAAPAHQLFDAAALMENLGDDKAMLAEVILLCRENDAPRLLAELAQSIQNGDADGVAKAAHALKGMAGAFNATDAWSAAKTLETTARAGKVISIKEEADEFVRALRALLIGLENFAGVDHRDLSWI